MAIGPPVDPGLQPERTALAWTRTTLSLLVVGVLMARMLTVYQTPVGPALILIGLIIVLVVRDQAGRHQRAVHAVAGRGSPVATVSVLSVGLGSAMLAVIVLAATVA
ncbi:MAG: DUF202 domain-containing protein [Propioniciclava sp.]